MVTKNLCIFISYIKNKGTAEIWKFSTSTERTTTVGKDYTLNEKNPIRGSTGGLEGVEPVARDVQPNFFNLFSGLSGLLFTIYLTWETSKVYAAKIAIPSRELFQMSQKT